MPIFIEDEGEPSVQALPGGLRVPGPTSASLQPEVQRLFQEARTGLEEDFPGIRFGSGDFTIGGVDALAGLVGAKHFTPGIRGVLVRELANIGVQMPVQAALGAAGEAGAQVASGQPLNTRDIAAEAIGEFSTASVDVAAAAVSGARSRRGQEIFPIREGGPQPPAEPQTGGTPGMGTTPIAPPGASGAGNSGVEQDEILSYRPQGASIAVPVVIEELMTGVASARVAQLDEIGRKLVRGGQPVTHIARLRDLVPAAETWPGGVRQPQQPAVQNADLESAIEEMNSR